MGAGLVAITACFGYLYYMNHSYRKDNPTSKVYVAIDENGEAILSKRKSRWD